MSTYNEGSILTSSVPPTNILVVTPSSESLVTPTPTTSTRPNKIKVAFEACIIRTIRKESNGTNTEFVSFTNAEAALKTTRKILKYEEVGSCYVADHWRTLMYPLSLLLIAQKAYKKNNDPEWILLINTKTSMEAEEAS